MPSYTFRIRKADHILADGKADLHVHVYFNEGHSRKLSAVPHPEFGADLHA